MTKNNPSFDNRRIDIISRGKDDFIKAMSFFMDSSKTVHFYRVDEKHGMVLYWPKDLKCEGGIMRLPYPMKFEAACDFVWNWLEALDYGDEPDHDGDNKKAWNVYNEDWTHVAGRWEGLVGIRPTWAMSGK